MNTNIDDLVRGALQRQADRAASPERIRAALPALAARRARVRAGTLVAVVTAAAVTVAVTVPVLVLRGDDHPTSAGASTGADGRVGNPPVDPSSGTPGAVAPPGKGQSPPQVPQTIPMRYRPTWLPAGLAERSRSAPLAKLSGQVDGPVRTWTVNPTGARADSKGPRLDLYVMDKAPSTTDGTPVDVGGRPGYLVGSADSGKAYLQWTLADGTALSVSQHEMGLSGAELLQIARSVRPDPAQLWVPVRPGWLPAGMSATYLSVGGDSPSSWLSRVSCQEVSGPSGAPPSGADAKRKTTERQLTLSFGTSTDAPVGGERITVGGRPARIIVGDVEPGAARLLTVVVEYGAGRLLTARGGGAWSRDDLVRVAGEAVVEDLPDLSWLGGR